jgi:hypothetical protein
VTERRYVEPARAYVTSAVLLLVLLGGFVIDLALGGGRAMRWRGRWRRSSSSVRMR